MQKRLIIYLYAFLMNITICVFSNQSTLWASSECLNLAMLGVLDISSHLIELRHTRSLQPVAGNSVLAYGCQLHSLYMCDYIAPRSKWKLLNRSRKVCVCLDVAEWQNLWRCLISIFRLFCNCLGFSDYLLVMRSPSLQWNWCMLSTFTSL